MVCKDIVRIVENSVNEGVKEIWLSSEDTGAYGRDIGESFPDLLNSILDAVPKQGVNEIRCTI